MTLPALPPPGSTNWYDHYSALDEAIRTGSGGLDDAEMAALVEDEESSTGSALRDALIARAPAPSGGDDSAALQDLLDAGGRVILRPGATYRLASGLTVDPTKSALAGLAVVDASAVTSGAAITVTGTVSPPYRQAVRVLDGFELVGPGKATTAAVGVLFETPTSAGASSHVQAAQINVHGFGTGVKFGSRAYCIDLLGCDVWDCGTCIDCPAGVTDAGERLSLTHCTLYNSDIGVRAFNGSGEVVLVNCSLDYNDRALDVSSGAVFLYGCHLENYTSETTTMLRVAGDSGTLIMVGGRIVFNGASGTGQATHVIDNSAGFGAGAQFHGVLMNNTATTTGDFATGTGHTLVRNTVGPAIAVSPTSIGATANLLQDGGFAASGVNDEWFVRDDTATITSRLAGTNISAATSTDVARTGSRSLKVAKVLGAGSAATVSLMVPLTRGAKPRMRLYYAKPGTSETGSFSLSAGFATLRADSDGIWRLTAYTAISAQTVNVSAGSAIDWAEWALGEPTVRAPAWATYLMFSLNLTGMSAGAVYLDDVNVTEM